jgi:hypothetical protein
MIPFGLRAFRTPPTELYLNGPELEILTQPQNTISSVGGTSTFTSSVRAFFKNNQESPVADGAILYQWFDQNGPLIDGTKISGSKSNTLTISNVQSPNDNRSLYLRATYIPGGYDNKKEDYFFETKTSGSANNSPILTNNVSLTIIPTITITTQPESQTVGLGQDLTFTAAASTSDPSIPLNYYWTIDGTIQSNSNSTSFTVTTSTIGTQKIQFHTFVTIDGTQYVTSSNEADIITVTPRALVKFEAFDTTNNSISTQEALLDGGQYTLSDSVFPNNFNVVTFYAKEKDLKLNLQLNASKGLDSSTNSGGEGGTSTIIIDVEQNVEYTLLGVTNNSAIFLYKGSQLFTVVGQGGAAGISDGGDGGGIGLSGTDGVGTGGGSGGQVPTISLDGIYGSIIQSTTLQSGDSIASVPDGGRTISCTKGQYWLDQGVSPCSDNDTSPIKFRSSDGTEISGSDEIIRGFKPGYTITTTAGAKGSSNGGNGGNGAEGGQGGTTGGGGGGSGYTDGSVTLVSSTSGGNNTNKSSVLFSVVLI